MKNAKLLTLFVITGSLLFSLQSTRAATFTVNMYYYDFTIGDYYDFSPSSLTVAKGDSVTWVNADIYPYPAHSATSGATPGTPDGLWDSGLKSEGQSYTLVTTNLNAGTYPYYCNTDYPFNMVGTLTITNSTIAPPSVGITNPVTGAKFLAPANITLMVNATQTGGSITNVQFFSGTASLANVTSSPYNFFMNSTAAGNYSFKAVAMNNQGGAATSSVVNVFVLTNSILMATSHPTNGQLQLTITGIAGQTYATEASINLINWSAISTNVAPANTFNVNAALATNATWRFYRARQDLF